MNWLDMNIEEMQSAAEQLGLPKFRGKQLYGWLYRGAGFEEMKNIPADALEKFNQTRIGGAQILRRLESRVDDTVKYLFLLEDANIIEGVLMSYRHGNTLCISTQVGCAMGCAFCASTLGGLTRDLTAGEMLSQVLCVEKERRGGARAVTNVVLMGSGEPLENYDNVARFLRLVTAKGGINISQRNISLSTCGIPEKIMQLAQEFSVTLSVSLHAPEDELRKRLMPVAKKHGLDELMKAARHYVSATGRRVIFEYALIDGVNDSIEMARKLAALVRGLQCHVNLIPLNTVEERGLRASSPGQTDAFLNELAEKGVSATLRREMGADIQGACGQLRKHYLDTTKEEKA